MHGFAWGLLLTRRRFKRAVLQELEDQHGPKARARAEVDLSKPDRPDIYGVAEQAGLKAVPSNGETVARLYAERVGFTGPRSTTP